MGLETATYVNDLVATNPAAGDDVAQGDDHLRTLKAALKATFPNADKAFYFPDFGTKSADFSVASTEINKTFLVDTSGGNVTATLPILASGDDGWTCSFIKTGTNVLFIAPPTGTLQSGEVSGLAKCRRAIPGHKTTAMWTGSSWFVSRVPSVPIGTELTFQGATLPTGYEWPNGQTLTSASTNYPEFYSVNGNSGVVLDSRGRVDAGKDDMGGSSANRLTAADDGLNGDTLGATGGGETQSLVTANMPPYTPTGTTDSGGTDHYHNVGTGLATGLGGGGGNNALAPGSGVTFGTAGASAYLHGHTFTGNAQGGTSTAFGVVQPTIIKNKMLVVE